VHQAQGGTFKHVVLVRPFSIDKALHAKIGSHYIVAVSRHTDTFTYATVDIKDTDVYASTIGKQVVVDDILAANGAHDLRVDRYYNQCVWLDKAGYSTDPPPVHAVDNPLEVIQNYYDEVFPQIRNYDNLYNDHELEYNDLEFAIPDCKLTPSKAFRGVKTSPLEGLARLPKLKTAQPWDRPSTQRQLLTAVLKRNCNAPNNAMPRSVDDFHTRIWPRFKEAYCVPQTEALLRDFREQPVYLNPNDLSDFVNDLKEAKLSSLERPVSNGYSISNTLSADEISMYDLMIKRDPKNVLDATKDTVYQALQVIAASNPRVNAYFGGMFRELFRRFRSVLKPNVYCHLRKSISSLEEHLNQFLDKDKDYFKLEIDESKFDKSQLEFIFAIEQMFWEMFGLNSESAQIWAEGHSSTTLRSWLHGFTVQILFQRKSGDVTTCFGNTIINMMALADCFELTDAAALYFVGDDSFLYLLYATTTEQECMDLMYGWNFEAKVIQNKGVYFCSCFIVHDGYKFRVLPDPLKRIERLSKPVPLSNVGFLNEMWTSFKDLMHNYRNAAAVSALCEHVRLRYKTASTLPLVAGAFVAIMDSYDTFESLSYPIEDLHSMGSPYVLTDPMRPRRFIVGASPCSGKTTYAAAHPGVVIDFDSLPAVRALYAKYQGELRNTISFGQALKRIASEWFRHTSTDAILLVPWTDDLTFTVKVPKDVFYSRYLQRRSTNTLGKRGHMFIDWYEKAPKSKFTSFEAMHTALLRKR
jgi:hypothetical protein